MESAHARSSPTSVSDHVKTSQDWAEVEYVELDFLFRVLQKFRQFYPRSFLKVCFFILVIRSLTFCDFDSRFVPLGCFTRAVVNFLLFLFEFVSWFFDKTHVFRSSLYFILFCSDGVLSLSLHVVVVLVLVTISWPAKTTQNL